MSTPSPILVGTDFSPGAALAVAEARRLACLLDVRLEMVHVAESASDRHWSEDPTAAEWLAMTRIDAGVVLVRAGLPWIEIARCARELGASLVVIGSHGLSGFQPLALGSTAVRVSLIAEQPVVVVNPRSLWRGRHGTEFPIGM